MNRKERRALERKLRKIKLPEGKFFNSIIGRRSIGKELHQKELEEKLCTTSQN